MTTPASTPDTIVLIHGSAPFRASEYGEGVDAPGRPWHAARRPARTTCDRPVVFRDLRPGVVTVQRFMTSHCWFVPSPTVLGARSGPPS